MRPSITQRCLQKPYFFFDQKHLIGGLDLQYRTPEREYPSRETEKENFTESLKGQKFERKARNLWSLGVMKQKQHCVAVAIAVIVS